MLLREIISVLFYLIPSDLDFLGTSDSLIPGLTPRKAAWEILQAVASGSYADVALERVYKKYGLTSLDRSLTTEISYGSIRKRIILDSWIDFCGKLPAIKQPPLLRWLLHIGIYQILFMEKIPVSAAVNTSVQLIKTTNLKKLAPVVNGLLRNVRRCKVEGVSLPLPLDSVERLAKEHSFPPWLASLFIEIRGFKGAELIIKKANQVPTLDLRVNRLKTNSKKLKDVFASRGIESSEINGFSYSLKIISSKGDLREWPGYKEGHWSVQDRSAQMSTTLLCPQPGEKILDACAAPGGKTTHIAELMEDRGEIWAVDKSQDRLKKVSENANRLGLKAIHILKADSSKLLETKPEWQGYFHKILLDAPCSGLGTLSRNPDARWRITEFEIEELIKAQFLLLEGLRPLLRPGGKMVYVTCTIHPKENFKQIARFLENYSDMKLLKESQTWPENSHSGDGFYVASMELENKSIISTL